MKAMSKRIMAAAMAGVICASGASGAFFALGDAQTLTVEAAKKLTRKQARKKAMQYIKDSGAYNENCVLEFNSVEDGSYLFQYYEEVESDGDSHTATVNWYYVNAKTGKVKTMF